MKPFQIVILAIFVVGAILGVIAFATTSGFSGGPKVGTVVIWGTLPQQKMDDEISRLIQSQKQFADLSYRELPEASFDTKVADALASGTGPDLLLITQEQFLGEKSKLTPIPLANISKRTFVDTYPSIAQLFFTDQGAYALPLVVDPLMMYFNRTQLAAAGSASAPSTWEAVAALAPRLTHLDASQNVVKSAIAFGLYENIENARAVISLLFLQSGSPITTNASGTLRSALFSDQGSPLEAALNYYTQFANPAKTIYSWNRSLPIDRTAFTGGNLSLYFGYASERPFLEEANPNLDFDMAKVPQASSGGVRATYARVYGLAMTKATGNPSGALAVAKALAEPVEQAALAESLSMAPASNSLLEAGSTDLYGALYYPEALVASGWVSPATSQTDMVFSVMIQNVLTGRLGVAEALNAAHQSLNTLLPQ